MDLTKAILTEHALLRLARRDILVEQIRAVLAQPELVQPVAPGRVVAQGIVGALLLRVFVDVDRQPPAIVTAYLTSKIGKYRRLP